MADMNTALPADVVQRLAENRHEHNRLRDNARELEDRASLLLDKIMEDEAILHQKLGEMVDSVPVQPHITLHLGRVSGGSDDYAGPA